MRVADVWRARAGYRGMAVAVRTLLQRNKEISRLVKERQIEQALGVLQEIKEAKQLPDVFTYSSLISGCAKTKKLEKAFQLMEEMKASNVAPNVFTYTSLIDACGKAQRGDRAFALFNEMKKEGVEPTVVTYTSLIDLCGKQGKADAALEIFNTMKQSGVAPNSYVFCSLINALCHKNHLAKALSLLEEYRGSKQLPSVEIYSVLIQTSLRLTENERAYLLFQEMKADGVISQLTLNLLLKGFIRAGQTERIKELLEYWTSTEMELDDVNWVSVVLAYLQIKEPRTAESLTLQGAVQYGHKLASFLFESVQAHYATKSLPAEGIQFHKRVIAEKMSVALSLTYFRHLIQSYLALQQLPEALMASLDKPFSMYQEVPKVP